MARYVTRIRRTRAEYWHEDWQEMVPDVPHLTVYDEGDDFIETGLLDADGNELVRLRERIGY